MHDAVSGERLGVPAAAIMTTEFVSAAELMAKVLGLPGYPFVVIDHPISSATVAELSARAQAAAEHVATLLTTAPAAPTAEGPQPPRPG